MREDLPFGTAVDRLRRSGGDRERAGLRRELSTSWRRSGMSWTSRFRQKPKRATSRATVVHHRRREKWNANPLVDVESGYRLFPAMMERRRSSRRFFPAVALIPFAQVVAGDFEHEVDFRLREIPLERHLPTPPA